MSEKEKILELEAKLQYIFNDVSLLKLALTHKSYAYEKSNLENFEYNERIEFLGDAILEHIISNFLFKQKPIISEGDMTKKRAAIVCEASLSSALKRIDGQKYIYLGRGELATDGRNKDAIIADAFEAIIGAIYIDGGFEVAETIVLNLLDEEIKEVLKGGSLNIDYKTMLQEKLQKNGNVDIKYIIASEKGPEHDKVFEAHLIFNGKKIGEGIGKNKKQAEQSAAKNALEKNK